MPKTYLIPLKFAYPYTGHLAHCLQYYYWCLNILLLEPDADRIIGVRAAMSMGAEFMRDFIAIIRYKFPSLAISEENDLTGQGVGRQTRVQHVDMGCVMTKAEADLVRNGECMERVPFDVLRWMSPLGARVLRETLRGPDHFREKPCVGIINRAPEQGRHLVNSAAIIEMIRERFDLSVEETFFEDKNCQYQLEFNNTHDIIIAPHGANLSCTPFVPDYGLVVECANREHVPYQFFPGLSLSSGKSHCIVCDDHPFPGWTKGDDRASCGNNSRSDIHVDPENICEAIQDFIERRMISYKESEPHRVTLQLRGPVRVH